PLLSAQEPLLQIAALTLAMTSLKNSYFWMDTSHVVHRLVFAREAHQSQGAK
ncbi:MAG: hypothetical protein ACI92E_001959, partial [Oceanicoccus sp.]